MNRRFFLRNRLVVTALAAYQVLCLSGIRDLPFGFFSRAFATQEKGKAGSMPRIAVIDVGGKVSDESIRKNIVSSLRSNFAVTARAKSIQENTVFAYVRERQEGDRQKKVEGIKKAYKLLRDGKDAYNGMRMGEALERLSLAKREFVSNMNELKSNDAILDSYLYLGMVYVAMGKGDDAYSEFKKVLYLDNKKNLSSREYPPDVIKSFEKARQEIDLLARGTLLIDSTPSNCAVFVNAKQIGQTPINTTVPVGEYFVKVEKEGYLDWYQPISVEDKVNNIETELKPISADPDLVIALKPWADPGGIDPQVRSVLDDSAKKLSADILFLGWVDRDVRDVIAGQLYDARTRKLSYAIQSNLGKNFSNIDTGIQRLVNDLVSFIDQGGFVIAVEDIKTPSTIPIGPPQMQSSQAYIQQQGKKDWTKKWWVWALIGGIAAGATIGIVSGMGSGGGVKISVDNSGNLP